MSIPPTLLKEAEAAAKEYYPSDRHFMAGVRWLFARLSELSEGEFDVETADIDSEGYEHDVYTADPDGVASHPAKHWVDGRRWQHVLSQAVLLKHGVFPMNDDQAQKPDAIVKELAEANDSIEKYAEFEIARDKELATAKAEIERLKGLLK